MAALLIDLGPGDEVIMPSFTFVSTANAFVLRGARPVFVDIRPDTLNLDERQVEAAITPRTKAIVVVHYAGVACEMDALLDIARRHGLVVIEDAAHALMSQLQGPAAGRLRTPGDVQLSRDEERHLGRRRRAGHQRPAVRRARRDHLGEGHQSIAVLARPCGQVHVDGRRFVVSAGRADRGVPVGAARRGRSITARRLEVWNRYRAASTALEALGLRMPVIPAGCDHNAHLFYLLLPVARRIGTRSSPTSMRAA